MIGKTGFFCYSKIHMKNFIVFEGIDGSGTTTQINLLAKRFPPEKFVATAEPTQLETGKFLRRVLSGEISLDERTVAYLFAADRCEHVFGKGGIAELCASGKIVASDRYFFSSLAYQTLENDSDLPQMLNSPFPLPEILFYFKIDPKTAMGRVAKRKGKREIFENLPLQEKIAKKYDEIIKKFADNSTIASESASASRAENIAEKMKIVTIDATQPIDEIAEKVWETIQFTIKN